MKKHPLILLAAMLFFAGCSAPPPFEKPPLAEVKPVEDVYFGRTVSDPYRYMEELENPQVKEWFENQSAYARLVLDNIPRRKFLIDKMKEFDERKSVVIYNTEITDGDRYVYLKRMPEDESGKLFYRDGFEGEEHLLYDPETYDPESESNWVLTSFSTSIDGSRVAFELAPDGSESAVLKILDIENGTFYPEEIDRVWFAGASWLPDGKSFLYNRLKSADVHQMDREKDSKTFVHVLGQDPSEDKEYFSREMYPELEIKEEEFPLCIYDKESKMVFGLALTVDRHLRVFYSDGKEAGNDRLEWKLLFDKEDEVLDFEPASDGVYIYSSKDAPNFQILKASWDNPSIENAEVVVSEPENAIVDDFSVTQTGLYYVLSIHGVTAELYHIPMGKTEAARIELPSSAGSINLMSKGPRFEDFWVTIYGWSTNWARYKYIYDDKQFKREQLSTQAEYPEYNNLVVEELMIPSHDGVMVPLSLIYMKGLDKEGKTPVFISGYGAYGVSSSPFFSPEFLLWTLEGGIHAIAHVRGGGELGDEWHMAGFKQTKKNTWKDVIACAEYLIENGYTSPENIAVNSASAGGIFVGRSMTERPDLFTAAIPEVGVMNTLRGENTPNGPVNAPEFGTVKDSSECMALIEMDSYLNIKDGVEYPATLVTAGMNDPRVIAWQPAKFAARLQAANTSEKPILFWCDMESGHGVGDTKTKGFEKQADVYSFAFWHTGHPGYQPR